jgi:hypothetical protein
MVYICNIVWCDEHLTKYKVKLFLAQQILNP